MLRGGLLGRLISAVQTDPAALLTLILIEVPALLLALILHEMSHGYVALWCGDGTAKMMGRLSLKPSHHLDPIGTLCMVMVGFGWAKPVPVNPRNFRNRVRDDFFVSIAGVTMNFLLFLLSSFLMVAMLKAAGGRVPRGVLYYVYDFFVTFASINLSLAIFNLIPFPPLDGFHIVNDILLKGQLTLNRDTMRVCQIIFLVLCYSTNLISRLMSVVGVAVWNAVFSFYAQIL